MKKKNLLLGLTLGTLMSSSILFTGCSSDITFNQSDLDKALVNINEYLETQNNFSSEFAKNCLHNYLIEGFTGTKDNKFCLTITQSSHDETGRETTTYNVSEKVQTIGNITIFENKYLNEIKYQEIEFNPITKKYKITNYTSDMKTQVLEEKNSFDPIVNFSSTTLVYSYVLNTIVGLFDNYTMDILEDGTEVFKTYRTYSQEGGNYKHKYTESFIIKFKNKKMINLQSLLITEDLDTHEFLYQDVYTWDFKYDIEDITIDKTLYTPQS